MKNKLSSLFIGLILLITAVVPSLGLMVFHTSSMATGVSVILLLYAFIFFALKSLGLRTQKLSNGVTLLFIFMFFLLIHGVISLLSHDNFDVGRFFSGLLFLLFFFAGAIIFVKLALKVPMAQADFAVNFVFYILLLSCIPAILDFSPFSSDQTKPVFFFTEPSHFALNFLPLLLYVLITTTSKILKFFLFFFTYTIALLLESGALLAGITFIVLLSMPLKRIFFFLPLVIVLAVLNFEKLDYFTSRLYVSSDKPNLTSLVYFSGWERAYLNVKETFGLGVGFQQFGVVGSTGESQDILAALGLPDLNLMDGGFVATKLIGESGFIGIALLLIYIAYFTKIMWRTRKLLLGEFLCQNKLMLFFMSTFVMYFVDIFFRGTGYFSSSGFIFLASLIFFSLKSPNCIWSNKS
jgi:hypothetical protein